MSDEGVTQPAPTVFSSKERAALVAKALSEAARRARFSTRRRRSLTAAGFRARRQDRLFKLLRWAAFVCCFALPTGAAAVYYGLIASNQYVAEGRFTLRGGMPPSMTQLGGLTGAPIELIIQNTQIVMNFIQSRAAVEALNRAVGLEKLYNRDSVDWISSLGQDRPIEKVVKYWKSHIDLNVQIPSGIVTLDVRAFTPGDAVKLADAALNASDAMVNRMNDQMTHDAVDLAEKERQRSQRHLVETRANLERARNEEGILSATEASKALDELIGNVNSEMSTLQQQYESQRRFVRVDAPQMRNLKAKIAAAQEEVEKLEAQRTTVQAGGQKNPKQSKVLSGSMSKLEYAQLENTIAEAIYAGSLAALEQARLAAETKQMYINTFIRPVAAEEARYPKSTLIVSLVAGAGIVSWGLVLSILGLARNRLT